MFTITLQEQQYKTYILTDESAGSQIEVVPERGGIITRWRIQEQEIFYLDTERFTHPDLSVRGGNPILFPICGNLPDNTYTHNGQQYTLKQHGFARELPWEVTEQKTEDKASLTLVLNSNEQTKAVYPFDFQLIFTYELQGNTLAIRQEYKNLSSTPMPFSAGFHPYFLTGGDKNQLEFQIPSQQYQDQNTKEIHSFDGNFDFNRDEIDIAFKDLTSQSATVIDRSRQLKLSLDYEPIYSHLVFWTVKGKDFYCLEPWTAPRNALNTGENLTVVAPKASCTASVRLTANYL
ncbi:aldose epimerase [Nodularia spumigena]|uniref:aldose epimerase family protein n=1 Tax=Nodularia spumigena TaxID=70799 RepID=UPI00232ABA01|nr:aldose epimerase [Nodularia spumigena]MDB9303377.1 aldose epimerase [Nodularia spumigena CS-591/12]MDB9319573.1 aldose epimerase [Nodularia spumigena CS-590/01A]MDB9323263.1 aldose epimerase [Nodularia spumigena CS-591/07A]MDB9326253.1 aldose epimerase [Nodularia spumigena CS-590/02]MDB9329983.1 aldose epimerase [Nodularia spumigena CS-591/04]